jgi:secretion/DNA translocation related TadE-like protein
MSTSRGRPPRPDHGVATVWAAWWLLIVGFLGMIAGVAVMVAARQHQVDGAADLVAVSAAARLQRGGEPCSSAEEVAVANDVRLESCRVDAPDVVVTVTRELRLPFGLGGRLRSAARAGP